MTAGPSVAAEIPIATGGMKILKRSQRQKPRLSFVLLDWSVRESFHFLHYLSLQTVPRDDFEVIVVEYYSRESAALRPYLAEVDTWAVLNMPPTCYYHKHLMYNAGIVLARGEILVFCDSDAMARENLVGTILAGFDLDPGIVLHLDQFRNSRHDFYPFSFPSFDAVLGPGCINNHGGRTKGIAAPEDPLHELNYGACMCARRQDLVAIGGADEDVDYLGHVCGPYDMTFRLINFGRREVWHPTEFLYHTWHPGQAGVDNYLGPHDGRHMSTTALESLVTRRVKPYVENRAIQMLRENSALSQEAYEAHIVAPDRAARWTIRQRHAGHTVRPAAGDRALFDYRGFRVEQRGAGYSAHLIVEEDGPSRDVIEGGSLEEIQARIDRSIGTLPRAASAIGSLYLGGVQAAAATGTMMRRIAVRLSSLPGAEWNAAKALGRRTIDRMQRFGHERSRVSGSLASLIVNLHALRRRSDPALGGRRPVFLTDSRAVAYYLRALGQMGVVPRLDIVTVLGRDIGRWSEAASRQEGTAMLCIVARDVYARHHQAFTAAGISRRMTVL